MTSYVFSVHEKKNETVLPQAVEREEKRVMCKLPFPYKDLLLFCIIVTAAG